MRTLLILVALLPAVGCIGAAAPAAESALQAPAPSPAAPPAPLHHAHAYDAPPVGETEVKVPYQVPNGTARLTFRVAWSSVPDAALTIPGGAEAKLKDASGKTLAESEIGPGPLPGPYEKAIDAPAGGKWIVEFEGYAPGVSATVDLVAS